MMMIAAVAMLAACNNTPSKEQSAEVEETPKVYFTADISPEGLMRVYEVLGVEAHGNVAVKISTGEPGGKNFLQPALIKETQQAKMHSPSYLVSKCMEDSQERKNPHQRET